ncbi:hypothetical protein D3C73_160110 [compost metagenome]
MKVLPVRQKPEKLAKAQVVDLQQELAGTVVHLVADDKITPQSGAGAAEAILLILMNRHLAPLPGAHLHVSQIETVSHQTGHHLGGAAGAGQHARIGEHLGPVDRQALADRLVAKPHQGKHQTGEAILTVVLKPDVVAILAPDPVQQGQQAVMEEVQKQAELLLPLGVLPRQRIEVITGHRRLAAVQAEEGHLQLMTPLLVPANLQHVAGREPQRGGRLEADVLVPRQVVEPPLLIRAIQPVEQLNQLEKVEAGRLPGGVHIREC